MMKSLERRLFLSAAAAGLLAISVGSAASPLKLEFVTHAAFFSAETK